MFGLACKALQENVKLGHDLANMSKRIERPITLENADKAQAVLSELQDRLTAILRLLNEMQN
jgi:hypothetical protein